MNKRPATMRPQAVISPQRRHLRELVAPACLWRGLCRSPILLKISRQNPTRAKTCPKFAVAKFSPKAATG